MKYSVIIPVYNTPDIYLLQAIDSVMNQTFKDFEVHVWNDGSNFQETLRMLQYIKRKYPEIIIHNSEHLGIPKIRNLAVKSTDCDVIIIQDPDDISYSDRFEKQINYMIEHDADVVACEINGFNEVRGFPEKIWLINHPEIIDKEYFDNVIHLKGLYHWILNCQTAIFKRSLFDEGFQYDETKARASDLPMFAEMFAAGKKIMNIQEPLLYYRVNLIGKFWNKNGHLDNNQRDFIQSILEKVNPKYCLETGFATGRSCITTLVYGKPEKMISVDLNLDYLEGRANAEALQNEFKNLKIIEGNSKEILTDEFFETNFPKGIDYSFVDGGHDYDVALSDISKIYPHINKGGYMLVDDYYSGIPAGVWIPEVNKAVDDWSAENNIPVEKWYCDGKGIAVIKKI